MSAIRIMDLETTIDIDQAKHVMGGMGFYQSHFNIGSDFNDPVAMPTDLRDGSIPVDLYSMPTDPRDGSMPTDPRDGSFY
jgi:hypothetical protein